MPDPACDPTAAHRLGASGCDPLGQRRVMIGPCHRRSNALADPQTDRRESCARVSHVTQVAVVGRGRVTKHGVDPRDFTHRQLRTIEPHCGFRLAAALLRQLAYDSGGINK